MIGIYGRYLQRSSSLHERFTAQLPVNPLERIKCEPVHQSGRTWLVVRLQRLWGEFCRELIVQSAMGRCTTSTNRDLSRSPYVKKVSDIHKVIKLKDKDLAGPAAKWEEPRYTIEQAGRLELANFNSIDLGLSGASTITDNIKCVRNYLIHPNRRNSSRYTSMVNMLDFNGVLPDQLLLQTIAGGETVFENWLSALTLSASIAVA